MSELSLGPGEVLINGKRIGYTRGETSVFEPISKPGMSWPIPEQIKRLEEAWAPEFGKQLVRDISPDRLDAMAYGVHYGKSNLPETSDDSRYTENQLFAGIDLTPTRAELLRAFLSRVWSWLPSVRVLAFSLVGLSFCLVDYSNPSPWWAPLSWALGTLCTLLLLNPAKDDDREWWQQ